jgi:hypothetical protein
MRRKKVIQEKNEFKDKTNKLKNNWKIVEKNKKSYLCKLKVSLLKKKD